MNDAISRSDLEKRIRVYADQVHFRGEVELANGILKSPGIVESAPALDVVPLDRLGDFGKLFMDYKGCPRGAMGRACMPIEEEVLQMKPITDVDGGRWIPVNADALHELVKKYASLRDSVQPIVHAYWYGAEFDGYADGCPVYDTWACSNCHEEQRSEGDPPSFDYCPICGARMDGDPHDSGQ